MKILTAVTMSGDVSMASLAKDRFTLGSELERDNPDADVFTVWANSTFQNDVTLGSSSIDVVTVKGQLTASNGISSNTFIFTESGSNKYRLNINNGNLELYSYDRNKKQVELAEPSNSGSALVVYGNGDYQGLRVYNSASSLHWNVYTEQTTDNLVFNYNLSGISAWITNETIAEELDFTGQHRCEQANANENFENKVGLIVVATGEYSNIDGSKGITINEALPKISLSAVRNQKNVFGVISNKEDDSNTRTYKIGAFVSSFPKETNDQRIIVNSLGEGAIWVCNINGDLENGDYITTCEIPGFGMKQDDGFLRNYTVAKITTDCNFDLNSNTYDCVEFEHNGTIYRKAFVGCTYHCG